MSNVSLPVISNSRRIGAESRPPPVDRSRPYKSCIWLEGGLAFNRRSLNACLIVHHNRGYPQLCEYNGGELDIPAILRARERIISANQRGGHPDCSGCPHLVLRRWPRRKKPFRLIGIAQFTRCNIECNYCYLQTDDPAKFAAGNKPYAVLPALRQLIDSGSLARRSIVDWGGGEPTIYPEFDQALELLTRFGASTWVHTNGTRLPRPTRNGLSAARLNVLCSIDAGTRETWKLIKNKDLLHIVWRNLEQYVRHGARVVLKYIVTDENCSYEELAAFIVAARASGARELIIDLDYNHPSPTAEVIHGMQNLKRLAIENGFHTTFGSTGANFTPEIDVGSQLDHSPDDRRLARKKQLIVLRQRLVLATRKLRAFR